MSALVSVVIPSYGGGDFLKRSVDSVLKQTYKNIEVIVVDDNGVGTENQLKTAKVMEAFSECDNVKYVCHEVNKNGSAARNTGVKNSGGEYIALLDDDDIYYPEKIEKQVEAISKLPEEYGLVYCGISVFRNGKKIRDKFASQSESWLYDLLIHRIAIGSSTLLVRRSVWEALNGFDESFRRHQDYEFTARVAANYKIMPVDYIGSQYNLEFRNSPKSAEIAKQYREHYLEKMMPYIETLPKKKQREVLVSNRVAISLMFLKERRFGAFIKDYFACKPGFVGFKILVRRLFQFIFRKK